MASRIGSFYNPHLTPASLFVSSHSDMEEIKTFSPPLPPPAPPLNIETGFAEEQSWAGWQQFPGRRTGPYSAPASACATGQHSWVNLTPPGSCPGGVVVSSLLV